MGIFDGITKVKAAKGSNYVKPGMYVAVIDKVKQDKSRKGEDFVAVEMEILKALEGCDENSHVAGEEVAHLMMDAGKAKDMFLPNIKAFISKCFGCPEIEVDEEACVALVGESQPMAGYVIELHAKQITTRSGGDFTQVNYIGQLTEEEFSQLGLTKKSTYVFKTD